MLATEFRSILKAKGLVGGMRALNLEAPHRYSAIFEFRGDVLHNLCMVDKLDPDAPPLGDHSIDDSYCIYVHRAGNPVAIEDARSDARVEGHPKRGLLFSYYGVPLFSDEGRLLGTVCHFDERPMAVPQGVAEALDDVAQLIVDTAFRPKP